MARADTRRNAPNPARKLQKAAIRSADSVYCIADIRLGDPDAVRVSRRRAMRTLTRRGGLITVRLAHLPDGQRHAYIQRRIRCFDPAVEETFPAR